MECADLLLNIIVILLLDNVKQNMLSLIVIHRHSWIDRTDLFSVIVFFFCKKKLDTVMSRKFWQALLSVTIIFSNKYLQNLNM